MGMFANMAKNNTEINDEVIVSSMNASAAALANAYLIATLTCTTPELRAMYGASLNQVIEGQSAFTALAVNKGWMNPYTNPEQQLADAYQKAKDTVRV
ncbi:MAG: spore coat protein [Firmicutes bacterium HGW-Firmicutes-12]|jgi:spore coat protein CotF|nr:MAG: spore coat protein [Firmicutes bacterium HGW-Firmicutes-12]